jgi:UDP-GlcNAc3NAcA epimerase
MSKKILTVVGARPQFIKAFPVSQELAKAGLKETIVHTGQHYDYKMSESFFDQLGIPKPAYNLEVGSGSHHHQIAEGLHRLEPIMQQEKPDIVLLYGDTNGTLSGALSAASLLIPIAHVEGGLRSHDRRMPEERNRIVVDHLSTWIFSPTPQGISNMQKEGLGELSHLVGDVMLDSLLRGASRAEELFPIRSLNWAPKGEDFILLTMHRAETTAEPKKVLEILRALDTLGKPIVFPVHPRTRPLIESFGAFKNLHTTEPLSYFEMLQAERYCRWIVTDSGGVQKEAALWGKPCFTLQEVSGWTETVELGFNALVGLSPERLLEAFRTHKFPDGNMQELFGSGRASERIAEYLKKA